MGEAGAGLDDQLREDPAVGQDVVVDDGIAVVVRGADAAERLEEGVAGGGAEELVAALVEDGEAQVVPLHVLGGADVAVDVGGHAAGGEAAGEADADAVEADAGGRGGGGGV